MQPQLPCQANSIDISVLSTMGQKRKRPAKNRDAPSSQVCLTSHASGCGPIKARANGESTRHPHPVISLYYPQVSTLRQYLLQQLPSSSKLRRRRIRSFKAAPGAVAEDKSATDQLAILLDTTLVGVPKESVPAVDRSRQRSFAAFTQSQDRSQCTDTGPPCPQSEVMSFYSLSIGSHVSTQGTDYLLDCRLCYIVLVQPLRLLISKASTPAGPWLPASYWAIPP